MRQGRSHRSTQSTITLTTNVTVLPINGKAEITAFVTESAGTPVQNGTSVYFTSTVGVIDPREARTEGGKARVAFAASGGSGTAKIGASSGAAKATEIEIKVGSAAATKILLNVSPGTVPSTGGSVSLVATVTDADGNRLAGVPITFTSTAGTLGTGSVVSDANGLATTTLTTNRPATVQASAGTVDSASLSITVNTPLTLSLTAPSGASSTAGSPVSFNVSVTASANSAQVREVVLDFGDGDRLQLGALTGATTVSHVYDNAGTYTATLTATDQAGERVSVSTVVSVAPRAPLTVNVTATPTSPIVQGVVSISTTVLPGTAQVVRYEYNFGDGVQTTLASSQTTHVYGTTGHKVITVRVVTVDGTPPRDARDQRLPVP